LEQQLKPDAFSVALVSTDASHRSVVVARLTDSAVPMMAMSSDKNCRIEEDK
jgi:hypothetical protein